VKLPQTPFSREPRDGRCVGPSFRVRNDMADLSKNRVCCGHAAGHFVGSQGASRAIGPADAAMGFSSTCPAHRIFHRWLTYGGTDRLIFGTLSYEQFGRTRAFMSSQNGDKARFNRLRKQKFRRRELMARLATQSAASAARLGKTLPAKLAQR
jgi:hypothetical protein